MSNSKKFRRRYVAGVFLFIALMFCLGLLVGDSYLLAVLGIAGWVVFLVLFVKYVAASRRDKK
jgi:small-conductance mechanosensitive channel